MGMLLGNPGVRDEAVASRLQGSGLWRMIIIICWLGKTRWLDAAV